MHAAAGGGVINLESGSVVAAADDTVNVRVSYIVQQIVSDHYIFRKLVGPACSTAFGVFFSL